MATMVLAAAGSAAGSSVGGSLAGIGAAALGKAVGATVGSLVDQRILGSGARAVESGRAHGLRLQGASEGAPVAQVYGRMRVAGQVIWSTRFREHVSETSQGGKSTGGQSVREFSYTISLAIALCEGPIDRVGRIWADGRPYTPAEGVMRVYKGGEDQLPDPKIEAVEGAGIAPAYRGTAYVVFEDLAVGAFGNRIPQFGFEVFRSPPADLPIDPAERGKPLSDLIRAVALSPGTGEFALSAEAVQTVTPSGAKKYANINNSEGRPDMVAALDQLDESLPNCEAVSLVVSWFGSDLRVSRCRVEPKIEERDRESTPVEWSVSGLGTGNAALVSRDAEGRPNFGGTPSDASVVSAIRELNKRGKSVMLYPFLLMDIPAGNGLGDPYGRDEQPPFPWRGRMTLDHAPGEAGTSDQTPAAADEVAPFFGTARAADFLVSGETVTYTGPDEWSWRRFVLHLAALAKAAGGVESLCIGSEFRGLTTIRDGRTSYPAVAELIDLAREVRELLPSAKLSYAADWSEYFGHQPADGSGDVIFHLDPLWASPEIDFIGIDDYTPLSDWRHSGDHLDRDDAASVHSLGYLRGNVEGGEHYDFYYASDEDRRAQARLPITDGAHGEDWIFRPKDVRGWWSNAHHNRVGGVRDAAPTAWQPGMKPVRLTETGCPAVDLGANQPNVFHDGRSSESAYPYFSLGARDDEMQRRFLQAKLGYWAEDALNPASGVYGGRMIEDVYVWTWDARPWPDFPQRQSVWSDGPAHRTGHWITGRVNAGSLAEVAAAICVRSGLWDVDVSGLHGAVDGYLVDGTRTAREALQPLMLAYGFDAAESGGKIVFSMRGDRAAAVLDERLLVEQRDLGPVERTRESEGAEQDAVRVGYFQGDSDYRVGAAEAMLPEAGVPRVAETSLAIAMPASRAAATAERWLAEMTRSRDRARFTLPPSAYGVDVADHVSFEVEGRRETYRVERITEGLGREVEAVRVDPGLYLPKPHDDRLVEPPLVQPVGPVEAVFLDLPLADGSSVDHRPWLAVMAEPWQPVTVWRSSSGDGFRPVMEVRRSAAIGRLAEPLAAAEPGRWSRVSVRLKLRGGAVQSRDRLAVLNGLNRLAVEAAPGAWEIVQFRSAELTGPGEVTVSDLLRGQRGTGGLAAATIGAGVRVVVLDEAVLPVPLEVDEIGLERRYRIGPSRYDHSHPSFVEVDFAGEGAGLRPFAPAHLTVRRGADGELAVSWVRTTRIGGDSWRAADVPLGEEAERYRVRIASAGVDLRTVETGAPAFAYTAAMQAADGAAGQVEIAVAQFSAAYGYGSERMLITNV